MARQLFESTLTDQQGHVVVGGSITVYLTGTLTAATIYSASSGGSAVTGSKVTSGSDGSYSFWIDESDYGVDQLFRVTLNGGSAFTTRTIDNIPIVKSTTVSLQVLAIAPTTDNTTGDGKHYWHIPASMNGMDLVGVHAEVITAGITGTLTVQIANVTDSVDMLSTAITIDTTETGSDTAATAAVINTSNDGVATNDVIRVDVDAIHSGTAAKGLIVTLDFRIPNS